MTPGRRLDLHVHSRWSPDGREPVARLVARAVELGLDGLALTDHNSVAGHAELAEAARSHPELRLIAGVEVSTRDGHLLAYGLTEAPPRGLPVEATVEWVSARGGVAVLAHPFRRVHGAGDRLARTVRVAAIEALNGHNRERYNARAREVANARSVGTTGGSDAHDRDGVGRAWTRFPEASETVEQLLAALASGRTVAEGRSATAAEAARSAVRSFALRLRRGLRAV